MSPSEPQLKRHPPLVLGRGSSPAGSTPGTPHAHATLWVVTTLEPWAVRVEGHIHVVRSLGPSAPSTPWQPIDISANALRPLSRAEPNQPPEDLLHDLRHWLGDWSLPFYRQPDLGLVSELGEHREGFRRRVATQLRPHIQKKLREIDQEPLPRLPWRRHSAEEARKAEKQRLAAESALLTEHIETTAIRRLADAVQSVGLGVLFVPPGVELRPWAG